MPRGKKRQPQRKNGWQEPLWNLVNRKSGTCEFRRSSRMVTCQRGFWDIWNTDNKKNEIRYFGGWRQDCRLRPFRVCTRPAWGQLVWQRVHRRGVHGEFLRAVQGTAQMCIRDSSCTPGLWRACSWTAPSCGWGWSVPWSGPCRSCPARSFSGDVYKRQVDGCLFINISWRSAERL